MLAVDIDSEWRKLDRRLMKRVCQKDEFANDESVLDVAKGKK